MPQNENPWAKLDKSFRNEKTRGMLREQQAMAIVGGEALCEEDEEGWFGEHVEWVQQHPSSSSAVDNGFDTVRDNIEDIFKKRILDQLDPPHTITLAELYDQFFAVMRVSIDAFEEVYELFVGNVCTELRCYRLSRPFAIGEAYHPRLNVGSPRSRKQLAEDTISSWQISEETIWTKNGLSLEHDCLGFAEFDPIHKASPDAFRRPMLVYVKLAGGMSPDSCENLQNELSRVLPSLIRTISLLSSEEYTDMPKTGLPWLTSELLEEKGSFISTFLNVYFSNPTKKQPFDRRIQNAIRLLVEADCQSNDAVALALSVAAIEALLGKKGTEIGATLADYVTTLLEPEPKHRTNAKEFVKHLYNMRSRVLHGEKLDGERHSRTNGRFLAAASLAAIVERRDFLHRSGYDPENPDDFFDELRKLQYEEGQIMGVTESPVRKLWRKTPKV